MHVRYPLFPQPLAVDEWQRLLRALIAQEELTKAGLMSSVWQCPVAMAPLNDDGSAEGEVVILRPVTSTEAMTVLPFAPKRVYTSSAKRAMMA